MLDKLISKLTERRTARDASFLGIARDIAAGRKVKIEAVEAVLTAGKTEDDLAALVKRVSQRNTLAGRLGGEARRASERQELEKLVLAADTKLAQAQEARDEVARPASRRWDELDREERQSVDARQELIDGCLDQHLCSRHQELAAALIEAKDNVLVLRRQMNRNKVEATECDREVKLCRTVKEDDWKEKAATARVRSSRAESELPAATDLVAELETQLAETELLMLVP